MGLGPSIKMTSLYHFNCPTTKVLAEDKDIIFDGIIIDGVSENCDEKIRTSKQTANLAKEHNWQGALVAIDGWGNHHVDFVEVIEQLGILGIPSVGLSYIGLQGRLVCDSPYIDRIIDFNKSSSGYESCIVGENNLEEIDAIKATALLKNKLKKKAIPQSTCYFQGEKELRREYIKINDVSFADSTRIEGNKLLISRKWVNYQLVSSSIQSCNLRIILPDNHNIWVNSNLDFMPIATKTKGKIGEGVTSIIDGVTLMITGCEESGFQPSNIGSSEGYLNRQVMFERAGTPSKSDIIIQLDFSFMDGQARTPEGIIDAHTIADNFLQEIRSAIKASGYTPNSVVNYNNLQPSLGYKIGLIKIVSGLGNMYDTVLSPNEPAGVIGGYVLRNRQNSPLFITANECRDGIIHSCL